MSLQISISGLEVKSHKAYCSHCSLWQFLVNIGFPRINFNGKGAYTRAIAKLLGRGGIFS